MEDVSEQLPTAKDIERRVSTMIMAENARLRHENRILRVRLQLWWMPWPWLRWLLEQKIVIPTGDD
jgi:regulator of replication initiation timing